MESMPCQNLCFFQPIEVLLLLGNNKPVQNVNPHSKFEGGCDKRRQQASGGDQRLKQFVLDRQ